MESHSASEKATKSDMLLATTLATAGKETPTRRNSVRMEDILGSGRLSDRPSTVTNGVPAVSEKAGEASASSAAAAALES